MKFISNISNLFLLSLMLYGSTAIAQEEAPVSRFSNRGFKASLGTSSFEMTSERNLKEGDGGALSVGYGFTDRFSLWLTLVGSEHKHIGDNVRTGFGGAEINLQHKFNATSKWQPYGKVGVGIYALGEDQAPTVYIGGGVNLGIGIDYLLGKHFAIGAEFMFKKIDYSKEAVEQESGDVLIDLNPKLNGDIAGFMLTFTVQ